MNANEIILSTTLTKAEKLELFQHGTSDEELWALNEKALDKLLVQVAEKKPDRLELKFSRANLAKPGNSWNAEIEGISRYKGNYYVRFNVMGDSTDSSFAEKFWSFFKKGEYSTVEGLTGERVRFNEQKKDAALRDILVLYAMLLPDEEEKKPTPKLPKYEKAKEGHPDAIMLFRVGDFYETYYEDAEKISQILSLSLTKGRSEEYGEYNMAGFPHHALDTYIHKIVRAGHRVAIVDEIETPKPKAKRKPSTPKEPKLAKYDRKKHQESAHSYYAEHVDTETRKKIEDIVRAGKQLPKELVDIAEETIYDWCEENHVDFDSFFDECKLGIHLRDNLTYEL